MFRRVISTEEGMAYAEENGLLYIETSAKAATGVQEAFMVTATTIYDKMMMNNNMNAMVSTVKAK